MNWKKSKRFFSNSSKKKQHLQLYPGLKGFLCTCNGTEKLCVKEAYGILNEYTDILNEEKKSNRVGSNNKNSEDIEDQFNSEVEMLNEKKKRFQAVNTSVTNCIFIKTEVEDPVALVNFILNDLKNTNQKKTRYLIRMIPIQITCYASLSNIKKAAAELFDKNFNNTEPTTFAVVYNCRYNSGVDRETIIQELATMVTERNRAHKVNLKHSKLTIVVEILKTVCCLSVLPEYNELAKYNLQAVVSDQPSTSVAGTASTNAVNKRSHDVARNTRVLRSKQLKKEASPANVSDDDEHIKNNIVKVFICDQKDDESILNVSDGERSNDDEIITSVCEPSLADCDNDEESNDQFKTGEYEVYDEEEESSTRRPNADLPTESAKKFKTGTTLNSKLYRLGEIQNITEKYDDLSNFCVYMASSLGRLVPDLRFKAQNEIQHIMSKYRIADLQRSPVKSFLNSSVMKEDSPSSQDGSDEEVWINAE